MGEITEEKQNKRKTADQKHFVFDFSPDTIIVVIMSSSDLFIQLEEKRCWQQPVCWSTDPPVVALGGGCHGAAAQLDVGEGGAAGEDGAAPGGDLGLLRRALGPGHKEVI